MAKTVKLCFATYAVNALIASIDDRNEKMEPIPRRTYSLEENEKPFFNKSYPVATIMVGIANKKENSTASVLERPEIKPPTIEAAERETPGIMESD